MVRVRGCRAAVCWDTVIRPLCSSSQNKPRVPERTSSRSSKDDYV